MEMENRTSSPETMPRISVRENWWNLLLIAALLLAIQSQSFWFLTFVHLFSSILWTGTDIFMGFILGPILKRIDFPHRRAVLTRLIPRMLFYMPTLAAVSITSGYYLAKWLGLFSLPYPKLYWVIAALVVAAILTIQGLGMLLPTNLRVYFEMRKEQSDPAKIQRLMGFYIKVVASQALMQLAIVIIMTRLRAGM